MKNRIAAVVIIVVGVLLYFLLAPSSSTPKTAPSNEAAAEDRMMAKGEIVNLVRQQSRLYSAEQTAHKKIVLSTTEKRLYHHSHGHAEVGAAVVEIAYRDSPHRHASRRISIWRRLATTT